MSRSQAMLDTGVEAVYDAGIDPEHWHDALHAIARLIDSPVGALGIARRDQYLTEIVSGADRAPIGVMNDMMDQNLWYQRRHHAPLNKAILGEELASPDEVKRTLTYSEILKPNGLLHMCAVAFMNESDVFGTVTLLRREREEPFGHARINLLDMLTPHISRAARISSLLQGVSLYSAGLEAATNRLSFGLILIDGHGRVLFVNSEAERLFASGRLKHRRDGRLTVASGTAGESRLSTFLDHMTLLREAAAVPLADSGGAILKLIGAPLPSRRRDFSCLASVAHSVIFVFDEAGQQPPPMRLIAELYSLTPAECRLAEGLLAGKSLAEYGEQAGLTRNTLKVQLRSLFEKTETVRQSDLLRKLARLSAVMAR